MADSQHESDDRQPDDNTTTTDQDGKPKRKLSGRAKLILLLVALAVVILGALWFVRYQTHGKYQEETNDARIQADAVTIAPRVTGYVEELLVGDNQDVKQGQPLVRINPRDYRAQVAQADAQIAVAAAQADSARAQIREQYATIEQTAAQLAAARTKAAYDASEVARYAPLAASGAETRERLAQLRTTAAQSAADVRAREAALALQQHRVEAHLAEQPGHVLRCRALPRPRAVTGVGGVDPDQVAAQLHDLGGRVVGGQRRCCGIGFHDPILAPPSVTPDAVGRAGLC